MKLTVKLISLFVCILVLIYAFYTLTDVFGLKKDENINIEIPSGATTNQISMILKNEDVINNSFVFNVFCRFVKPEFKYGMHNVNSNMSYIKIIKKLEENGDIKGITVSIPEGYEIYNVASTLKSNGLIDDEEAFLKKCDTIDFDYRFLKNIKRNENKLEGYLFPATYTFPVGASEEEIINIMLGTFGKYFDDSYYKRADELGMTVDEVITLASIIQRESASEKENSLVSGVFHNRLKMNMPLQSCATIQYVLKERKAVLSVEDTKINSPYNTYVNNGLPVGPIASPGIAAIEAALYPEDTDYLYFVVTPEGGSHTFSKTYDDHIKATEKAGL